MLSDPVVRGVCSNITMYKGILGTTNYDVRIVANGRAAWNDLAIWVAAGTYQKQLLIFISAPMLMWHLIGSNSL